MKNLFITVTLSYLLLDVIYLIEINPNMSDKCIKTIANYIHQVRSLDVLVLQEEKTKNEINTFTNLLIKHLINNGNISVTITEAILSKNATISSRFCPLDFDWDKTLSRVHVIIAWNLESVKQYFDGSKELTSRSRDFFGIFSFTSPNPKIVPHFWLVYNILNVTIWTCNSVHSYLPFHRSRNGGTWGTVQNHSMGKITNFDQYPIEISMFERQPTATKEPPKLLKENPIYLNIKGGFFGLDGFILDTIIKHLNFKLIIITPDETRYGEVLPNGTITGSLSEIVYRKAQIGTNGRFFMDYHTEEIEFTVPYASDKICAIVPKSTKVPQWMMLFNCFNLASWLLIFCVYVVCVIVWYLVCDGTNPLRIWWQMHGIFFGIPVKIVPTQMIFLVCCMIFNIIIIGLIQGSFFKTFTTIAFYKDITTLEELDQSGLPIAPSFFSFGSDGSNKVMTNLEKKKIKTKVADVFDVIAYKKTMVKLERERDLRLFVKTNYLDKDGEPLLYIVDECLMSFFVGFIVPKGSIFLPIFNRIISRIFESGLTLKWYNDVEYSTFLEKMIKLHQNDKTIEPFSLEDIRAAFFVLIVGEITSLLIFFTEFIFRWYKLNRKTIKKFQVQDS